MAPSADTNGLTAWERRRAENAKVNNEILNSISKTSAKVFGPVQSTAPTKKKPSRKAKAEPVKRELPIATRRSARVAGLDADPETLKRKLGVDLEYGLGESAAQTAREKRLRVSGDLNLSDMQVDGRWQGSLAGLTGLTKMAPTGAQPGVRTFTYDEDEGEKTTDKTVKALRQEMNSLQLYEKFEVKDLKLTKERIYAMAFHPTEDKPIIFAGDKEGRLGIFDASQEPDTPLKEEGTDDDEEADAPEPVILGFKPHARTISSICVLEHDPSAVYTSSYDTTIRKLDIEQQKSVEVYAPPEDAADDDMAISCMDFASDNPHLVFFSTLKGTLGRHDLRAKPNTATTIWTGLHDGHKIGGFSLSPRQPHLVATASLDRTLKIWDLRKIVTHKDDDGDKVDRPSLIGEDPARLSVSHAAWGSGGQIATTSYDDTIRIYDFADAQGKWTPGQSLLSDADMKPRHRISHNNQTGRWVTILKPQWQRRPPQGLHKFTVGNMNRFVDVFAANGEQLGQLDGDGITAVPAVAHFHPSRNWVAGGNASGKLTLWM